MAEGKRAHAEEDASSSRAHKVPRIDGGDARHLGEVTEWNRAVGYCFIRPDLLGPTVFLHRTALSDHAAADTLADGVRVEFSAAAPQAGERAERAYDVRIVATARLPPAPSSTTSSAAAASKISSTTLIPRAVATRSRKDGAAAATPSRRPVRDPEAAVLGYY